MPSPHPARAAAAAAGIRLRRAALLLGLVLVAALVPPPAAPAVTVGIADQNTGFMTTPAFQRTRLGHVRLFVPWDAVRIGWQRDELDRWLITARLAGLTPLVTFSWSREDPGDLPTPARYRAAVDDFRARYPWVREFSSWNEANGCGARTCRRAARVAAFWRELRLACPGCTVLAADLVDAPNIGTWVRQFRRASRATPTRWGLHNYLDANRFSTRYTRAALRAIGPRAQLWLTETGGLVRRRNASGTRIPEGFTHASRAVAFLFDRIRRLSPRIQRIYVYHLLAAPSPASWDSALLGPDGQERRAYRVLRDRLARLSRAGRLTGRLRSCAPGRCFRAPAARARSATVRPSWRRARSR